LEVGALIGASVGAVVGSIVHVGRLLGRTFVVS
jgi:hypothetical protein